MTTEDLLFHGKQTESGKRILEYPTYKVVRDGLYWNVLCSVFGNSGHLNTEAEAWAWVRRNIKHYVRLEHFQELEKRLKELDAQARQQGYDNAEDAIQGLAVYREQEYFGHTGD